MSPLMRKCRHLLTKMPPLVQKMSRSSDKNVTKDVTKELPERQLVILQMIYTNASVTISEMSQKTGVVIRTIKRDIEKLQASGILTRKGGRKDGKWLLTELGQRVLEERSANKTV